MFATVTATTADGHTLQQFANLIQQRNKWLNESVEDSVAACAIDILKSLRAVTMIANYRKTKIDISPMPSLKLSYTSIGTKKVPCLRTGKVRYIPPKGVTIRYVNIDKTAKVYKFAYTSLNKKKTRIYLIVANSSQEAKKTAKKIVKRRAELYKGLARRALGQLMFKTSTLNPPDVVSQQINTVADSQTFKIETKQKQDGLGNYGLTLVDQLEYAKLALKGGDGAVTQAIQKASNKIVSIINMKCKDILGFTKIDSPFPEVKKRR